MESLAGTGMQVYGLGCMLYGSATNDSETTNLGVVCMTLGIANRWHFDNNRKNKKQIHALQVDAARNYETLVNNAGKIAKLEEKL